MSTQKQPAATETWIERIEFTVSTVIQVSITVIVLTSIIDRQWLIAFSGAIVLVLSFVPSFIERQLRVHLPVELSLFASAFLFASFVLGEVRDFYERLWWWDIALHASSAFVIGLIGFLSVYVFYMTNRIRIDAIYIAAISFGIAITVGTLWEILEFLMDLSFGLNMQKSGLVDTMTDLMVNACGALTASAIGYYYVRRGDELLGRRLIRSIVERLKSSRAG